MRTSGGGETQIAVLNINNPPVTCNHFCVTNPTVFFCRAAAGCCDARAPAPPRTHERQHRSSITPPPDEMAHLVQLRPRAQGRAPVRLRQKSSSSKSGASSKSSGMSGASAKSSALAGAGAGSGSGSGSS